MKHRGKQAKINNERGIATVETALLLFVFVMFMGFTTGMFGVIHAGILHSISARAYAFETFRNRANVSYHRNPALSESENFSMVPDGIRFHGISEITRSDQPISQQMYIHLTDKDMKPRSPSSIQYTEVGKRQVGEANPIYLKIGYGICLNAKCGG